MAYRDFGASAVAHRTEIESPAAESNEVRFAPLELQVIGLAEADPVASIGAPTRFARWFERWFGFERPAPLADARLEALRRFAVLVRVTGGRLPREDVERFLTAGFTLLQARALQRRAAPAY
jgi:hypothetical protein